jgi:hypothetical protein
MGDALASDFWGSNSGYPSVVIPKLLHGFNLPLFSMSSWNDDQTLDGIF